MKKVGIPLPVFPRKRYIFVIDCPKGPGRSMPMLVDTTGVYCRPDGNGTLYICGQSPSEVSFLTINFQQSMDQFPYPFRSAKI